MPHTLPRPLVEIAAAVQNSANSKISLSTKPRTPKSKSRATKSSHRKMALSSPPPPPDASPPSTSTAITTTTATTATTHAARPPFPPNPRLPPPHSHPIYPAPFYPPQMIHPHPPHLLNSRLPSNPNFPHSQPHDVSATASTPSTTNTAILYPVASSGRGFLQKQPPSVALPNSNPNSHPYSNRSGVISYTRPLFGYPHSDPGQGPGMGMGLGYVSGRPTHLQQAGGGSGAMVMPGVINSVPVASTHGQRKITVSSTSNADCNGHRDTRERSRDDSFVTIRDRKVRMSENASVYALCRSWMKNGSSEESQPVYMDGARSLPRPLPLQAQDNVSPVKKDDFKEEVEEEGSVENLTPEELLQTHIKRAKRVRLRLREERLQRIARYKTRLALLLPPMVEHQLRNDSASGN